MPDDQKNDDVFSLSPETNPETPETQSIEQTENQPDTQQQVTPIAEPIVDPVVSPVTEPTAEPISSLQTESEPLAQPLVAPIGSGPDLASTPVSLEPKKKRKGLVVGAIIVGALLLLSGTSAAAYTYWYQNPEKVVTDSLVHALTAQTINASGVATIVGADGYTLKIEVDGHNNLEANVNVAVKLTVSSEDLKFTVDGEGIFSKDGDIYVKVNEVQKFLDTLEDQSDGAVSYESFGTVIKKIDGNWIKISKDDLNDVDEDVATTQKCFAEVSKSLESDKDFRKAAVSETEKLYKENNFITIGKELPSRAVNGQDSLGYPISLNRTKADAFFTGFADSQLGKKLTECDDKIDFPNFADGYNTDEIGSPDVELWVSRFGHEITELNWKYKDDEASGNIVINPVFNKNEAVTIPTESVDLKEVLSDFEDAYSELYSSYEEETDMPINYN